MSFTMELCINCPQPRQRDKALFCEFHTKELNDKMLRLYFKEN